MIQTFPRDLVAQLSNQRLAGVLPLCGLIEKPPARRRHKEPPFSDMNVVSLLPIDLVARNVRTKRIGILTIDLT